MGYQALLFCPDDKTARTVTQILSELEFTVEACIEPFAAVKKLMGQHFDAVVVDCDNEQNATLLFKSARNSTSNQTSLAVAVVEGQAGVAKAFRIGANLVLTRPINIEQAKGTLRVARGLLRKSDPTKPGSATATGSFAIPTASTPAATPAPPAAAPAPVAPKPVPAKPVSAVRPAGSPLPPRPVAPGATAATKPAPVPAAPKAAAPSALPAATASTRPVPAAHDATAAPAAEKPVAPVAPPALYSAVVATPAASKPAAPVAPAKPPVVSSPVSSGAASAPAPAREPQVSKAAEDLFEKPAEAAHASSEPATPYVGSAPSFGYGASKESEAGGGSKKIFIGLAAGLLIAAGSYFGWSHFKGTSTSSPQPMASSAPVSAPAASKPANPQPTTSAASTNAAPVSQSEVTLTTSSTPSEHTSESAPHPASSKPSNTAKASHATSTPEEPVEEEKPEPPALVVKGGKVPEVQQKPAPAPDAPAPLIGMGAPTTAGLPNLGTSDKALKPRLQTLSVSQGVSQGLLYKKVSPSYPQAALRMHIEGIVELMATISKDGNITQIKVLSGDPQLTRAASDAVKQWKYKPYLLNGEPVEIQTQVTVNFKLPH